MSSADSDLSARNVNFRPFQLPDFERLCELDRICFAEGIAYSPEEIARWLAQRGTFCYVAESSPQGSEAAVVAWVLATRGRKGLGHIITIDVHPDYRRRKLGEALMQRAEERLLQEGCQRCGLEVAVANQQAMAFYERRGYQRVRELPRYYSDGTDAWLMEKML